MILNNYLISFLINSKNIFNKIKKKKKKNKIDFLLLFNLTVIAEFIERLLSIVSFVKLKSTKENLFFLNNFFINF